MAAPTRTELGKSGTGATVTSRSVTTVAGAAVGDLVVVRLIVGTAATGIGVTDSRGNTYQLASAGGVDADITNAGALRLLVFWSIVAAGKAIQTGDTITASWTNSVTVAIEAEAWNHANGFPASPVDKVAVAEADNDDTPSSGSSGTTSQAEEAIVGAIGYAGGTANTLTAGAGWSEGDHQRTSGRNLFVLYKGQTAAAAHDANGTYSASQSFAAAVVTFKVGVAIPPEIQTPNPASLGEGAVAPKQLITIGYVSNIASTGGIGLGEDNLFTQFHSSTQSGKLLKARLYVRGSDDPGETCKVKCHLHQTLPNFGPGELIHSSDEVILDAAFNASFSWVDIPFSSLPTLPAGPWWISFHFGGPGQVVVDSVDDPARSWHKTDEYDDGPPNPYGSQGSSFDRVRFHLVVEMTAENVMTVPPPQVQLSGTATTQKWTVTPGELAVPFVQPSPTLVMGATSQVADAASMDIEPADPVINVSQAPGPIEIQLSAVVPTIATIIFSPILGIGISVPEPQIVQGGTQVPSPALINSVIPPTTMIVKSLVEVVATGIEAVGPTQLAQGTAPPASLPIEVPEPALIFDEIQAIDPLEIGMAIPTVSHTGEQIVDVPPLAIGTSIPGPTQIHRQAADTASFAATAVNPSYSIPQWNIGVQPLTVGLGALVPGQIAGGARTADEAETQIIVISPEAIHVPKGTPTTEPPSPPPPSPDPVWGSCEDGAEADWCSCGTP